MGLLKAWDYLQQNGKKAPNYQRKESKVAGKQQLCLIEMCFPLYNSSSAVLC